MVSEWDLFPNTVYANDPSHPIVTCVGAGGCGCLVANTFEARMKHVHFHNKGQTS